VLLALHKTKYLTTFTQFNEIKRVCMKECASYRQRDMVITVTHRPFATTTTRVDLFIHLFNYLIGKLIQNANPENVKRK
jgi:hypothetical protein